MQPCARQAAARRRLAQLLDLVQREAREQPQPRIVVDLAQQRLGIVLEGAHARAAVRRVRHGQLGAQPAGEDAARLDRVVKGLGSEQVPPIVPREVQAELGQPEAHHLWHAQSVA